jgi:hypothetical protein
MARSVWQRIHSTLSHFISSLTFLWVQRFDTGHITLGLFNVIVGFKPGVIVWFRWLGVCLGHSGLATSLHYEDIYDNLILYIVNFWIVSWHMIRWHPRAFEKAFTRHTIVATSKRVKTVRLIASCDLRLHFRPSSPSCWSELLYLIRVPFCSLQDTYWATA